jgi:hypothetical protein
MKHPLADFAYGALSIAVFVASGMLVIKALVLVWEML